MFYFVITYFRILLAGCKNKHLFYYQQIPCIFFRYERFFRLAINSLIHLSHLKRMKTRMKTITNVIPLVQWFRHKANE